ncbi:hypothetical protein AURDEDRAFT_184117 [Auricularia subglabra TFB-10046 SS5]|nr:hypothetical protein AURDEDRAFT_184117 [Auricularia subglabra TFB-10046 SS5]
MLVTQIAPLALASGGSIASLIPLNLTSTNYDLSDPSFNTTYAVSGVFKIEAQFFPSTGHSDTLLIAFPGSTYGTEYWNFPYQPKKYSFVRFANSRGFSVLNVARIGSGKSDHPDPERVLQVGLQVAAEVELAKLARGGKIGGRKFKNVVGLGHSLSSTILNGVLNAAPDALDGAVFTGFGHSIPPPETFPGVPASSTGLERFAGLPDGYLTTTPDTRRLFYGPDGTFDPAVLAFDEAHKDVVSQGEWLTIPRFVAPAPKFKGHVLVANGLQDFFACDEANACAEIEREREVYSGAASFETAVIENSGHDINLSLVAPKFFEIVVSWLKRHGF